MEKLIEVGVIIKPHGVKGQVKVKSLAFGNFDFKKAKVLFVDGVPHKVESVGVDKLGFIVGFEGVTTVDLAARLKNKSVGALRSDVSDNGGLFCADLIGLEVIDESGKVWGKVDDIQNFGSADVFYIKGKKPFLFSNIGGIIDGVDETGTKMIVNSKELEKVVCYED